MIPVTLVRVAGILTTLAPAQPQRQLDTKHTDVERLDSLIEVILDAPSDVDLFPKRAEAYRLAVAEGDVRSAEFIAKNGIDNAQSREYLSYWGGLWAQSSRQLLAMGLTAPEDIAQEAKSTRAVLFVAVQEASAAGSNEEVNALLSLIGFEGEMLARTSPIAQDDLAEFRISAAELTSSLPEPTQRQLNTGWHADDLYAGGARAIIHAGRPEAVDPLIKRMAELKVVRQPVEFHMNVLADELTSSMPLRSAEMQIDWFEMANPEEEQTGALLTRLAAASIQLNPEKDRRTMEQCLRLLDKSETTYARAVKAADKSAAEQFVNQIGRARPLRASERWHVTSQVLLGRVRLNQWLGNRNEARSLATRFTKQFPDSPSAPYAARVATQEGGE